MIAAPSYDELCSHIRDVQRQYTCGTAKDKPANPAAAMQVRTTPNVLACAHTALHTGC